MKRVSAVIFILLSIASFALAQNSQKENNPFFSTTPRQLIPEEAFSILKERNDQLRLLPSLPHSFTNQDKIKYNSLKKKNCFGVAMPGGYRIVGESPGKDYGFKLFVTINQVDQKELNWLGTIAVLVAETGFSINEANFSSGSYLITAKTYDTISLWQDGFIFCRSISLPIPLDSEFFKNEKWPKLRINIVDGKAFLLLGRNELEIVEIDWCVSNEDLDSITDQTLIHRIALKAYYPDIRNAALEKLNDQKLILQVACETWDEKLGNKAIDKLDEPKPYFEIVTKSRSPLISSTALYHVWDQPILIKIAKSDIAVFLRTGAIERLTDLVILNEIANNDKEDKVCQAATKRLLELKRK